jgi:glycosyltransferase involved in cell wall biosynthesis
MRVAFDSRPAANGGGVGRYARCLLEALEAAAPEDGELVLTHRPRRVDVLHAPCLDCAPLRPHGPTVVTVHDLHHHKRRGERLRAGVRFRLRSLAAQRATRVIVPTQAVAADTTAYLRLPDDQVVVIPEAVAPVLRPRSAEMVMRTRRHYGIPEDYLLWVGRMEHPEPRKRIAELAQAPRSLPLVLVGATSRWAEELPGVTLTGHVPDDDLAALYTGARALVFPSDDEGFGLPAIEALACGTPVVASDVPALREVLDGRATFVPVGDVSGLVAAAERAARPAPPPPAWTWTDAAHATWAVYREALAAASRSRVRPPREPAVSEA